MDRDTRLASEDSLSSSPAPAAVFSDEAARTLSPPSSPPGFPWDKQDGPAAHTKTQTAQEKNAFSVLGKRKALADISENARPAKKHAPPAPKALSQMQISLGQKMQKMCKVCGMEYVPSAPEDRKLHDKYHRQNVDGYDLGKDFVRKTPEQAAFPGARKEDAICVVDCYDSTARKRRGQAVLEIVQRELGAVEIPEDEVWEHPKSLEKDASARYMAYLYIRGTKCVGFLLVQRISTAFRVLGPIPKSNRGEYNEKKETTAAGLLKQRQRVVAEQLKQPLRLSSEQHSARLGVSRIWTSSTHRRGNIAMSLLQAALDHQNRCAFPSETSKLEIPNSADAQDGSGDREITSAKEAVITREKMAFSQPTEAGTRLARRWFGKDFGWAVYSD